MYPEQGRRNRGAGWGRVHCQIWADTFSLFQWGVCQPHYYLPPPFLSRFSDIPTGLQNCIPDAHMYPYRFSLVLSIIVLSLSIFVSLYIFDFFYHNYLWRTNSKHVCTLSPTSFQSNLSFFFSDSTDRISRWFLFTFFLK